jgi:hypothetical protein
MLVRPPAATPSLNLLHRYYSYTAPDARVLDLCGAKDPDTPYSPWKDDDLTVIINAWARPQFLPLVWEGIQYQTRRPRETWIIQNFPQGRAPVPSEFFERARAHGTRIIDSDLNHGCWFRFFLAALYCRTRFVAIYDDDTLSGRLALETAVGELERKPGVYGGFGMTLRKEPEGPRYWSRDLSGWAGAKDHTEQVDFVGQMWLMETSWLRELLRHVPERLVTTREPARECGEEMYVSFVAQRLGLPTYVYTHGSEYNARWSSIQAYEMGFTPDAMSMNGGLSQADYYVRHFVDAGWKLLRYTEAA